MFVGKGARHSGSHIAPTPAGDAGTRATPYAARVSESSYAAHPVPPSVRLALPAEGAQIAEIQRRNWRAHPATAPLAETIDAGSAAESWYSAIARPPMAHYRVLVAVEGVGELGGNGQHVVVRGFAAIGPSDDPDLGDGAVEVAEFAMDPEFVGLGHEDRLVNAVADTARADGYERLTWWVISTDDALRGWLTEAGWAPDGAHREIATDDASVRIKQIRMHTDISRPTSEAGHSH